jgi:hypothetical protein
MNRMLRLPVQHGRTKVKHMKRDDALKLATKCTEDLAESLRGEGTDRLRQYLDAIARFRNYSFRNVMMILEQYPNANHVAGFHTWRQLGRWVKAGESGIAIFAPMTRRLEEKNGEKESDRKSVFGFRVVHVFDYQQTDGKELFALSEMSGDPGEARQLLDRVYRSLGIGVIYGVLPRDARGASTGGRVIIREGLEPEMEFRVLAHELAHELLHQGAPRGVKLDHKVAETEAEAVAYVVCRASNVDSRDLSSEYIRLNNGDAKLLEASFERVRCAASHILFLMDEMKQAVDEVCHAA